MIIIFKFMIVMFSIFPTTSFLARDMWSFFKKELRLCSSDYLFTFIRNTSYDLLDIIITFLSSREIEDLKAQSLKFRVPIRRVIVVSHYILMALSRVFKNILHLYRKCILPAIRLRQRHFPLYAYSIYALVGPKSRPHQKFSGAIFRGPARHTSRHDYWIIF